ncbi:MAG: MerR family transcriptional regulator [Terriglobia bacterium]
MARKYHTIGQVVKKLKPDFPDLSISKVRYLEDEGLIHPERTKSGYRKFFQKDLDRLESVLRVQKDKFLPLAVIKERIDRPQSNSKRAAATAKGGPRPVLGVASDQKSFPRGEFLKVAGLPESDIDELEKFGLLRPLNSGEERIYGADDLKITALAKHFTALGIEARHLRLFEAAADREISLLWQTLSVEFTMDANRRRKARAELGDLLAKSDELRQVLVARALRLYFGKNLT